MFQKTYVKTSETGKNYQRNLYTRTERDLRITRFEETHVKTSDTGQENYQRNLHTRADTVCIIGTVSDNTGNDN